MHTLKILILLASAGYFMYIHTECMYACILIFYSSWWSGVEQLQGPPDAIFGLVEAQKKDPRPNKVSVVIGAYHDGQGKPWVLQTVRKVCLISMKGVMSRRLKGKPLKLKLTSLSAYMVLLEDRQHYS